MLVNSSEAWKIKAPSLWTYFFSFLFYFSKALNRNTQIPVQNDDKPENTSAVKCLLNIKISSTALM